MRTRKPKRIEWSRIVKEDPEKGLKVGECVICGKRLTRKFYGFYEQKAGQKLYRYARWERTSCFLQRKTCGKYQNEEGKWVKSECLKKYSLGERNPNYKGIMPRCIDCGKKISYKKVKERKHCVAYKRCINCFKKWAKETDYFRNTKQIKYIAERMRKRKGIFPEHLRKFAFKKGMRPHNKLYEEYTQCSISNCIKKPVAKMLCIKHYCQLRRKLKGR